MINTKTLIILSIISIFSSTAWSMEFTPQENCYYKIVNKKRLDKGQDAFMDSNGNNNNVYSSHFNNMHTKWRFEKVDEYYKIINLHHEHNNTHKFLNDTLMKTGNPTGNKVKWMIIPDEEYNIESIYPRSFTIMNVSNQKLLRARDEGNEIILSLANNNIVEDNKKWIFLKQDD